MHPLKNYCPSNHATKATTNWGPNDHFQFLNVGRSNARLLKFQKLYFIETLRNIETYSVHKHNAHMYTNSFQDLLNGESAFSRFEVITKPIYNCNEDRPDYAKLYQENFIQYKKDFSFATAKPSTEFYALHITVHNKAPSIAHCTKANIRKGYNKNHRHIEN